MVGKIVTCTDSELRTHRKANQFAAGLERWIHQGLRHTFCSNWLALYKDVNKLVLLSGHDSVVRCGAATTAVSPKPTHRSFGRLRRLKRPIMSSPLPAPPSRDKEDRKMARLE